MSRHPPLDEAALGLGAVAEARLWLGTPYRHQASCRGAGTDCLGLIRGIWRALAGHEPQAVPPYTPDWDDVSREEGLLGAARALMRPCEGEPWLPGEMVVFRMCERGIAKHLGLISHPGPGPRFIHAYSGHGVVESPLSPPWERRVAGRFRFRPEAFGPCDSPSTVKG